MIDATHAIGLSVSLSLASAAYGMGVRDVDGGAGGRKPNIVFIFADDWGWGDLSCHGSKFVKTPNIDKLAAEGTDFQCFNVNSPVCSPSRAALLTGQYPARNRIFQHFGPLAPTRKRGMADYLDPNITLLPKLLKSAGYATGHFGKWHLCASDLKDAPSPKKYGYDEYAVYSEPFAGIKDSTNETFDRAVEFIEKHRSGPFFVNVWIHQCHVPHYPKKKWLERFKDLDERHRVYAAVVAEGDAGVGEILAVLKQLGLEKDTLVVFSSDNGPERTLEKSKKKLDGLGLYYSVGETGGLRGRKRSLFEGGVRVPFICRWPGKVPAGKKNDSTVVSAVDVLPTFCVLAGVKLPSAYKPDGENMVDVLLGADRKRRKPLFWQWGGSQKGDCWPRYSVRDGSWKLVVDFAKGRLELYNEADDRAEKVDRATQVPERLARLRSELEAWIKEIPSQAEEKRKNKRRLVK